MKGYIGWIVVWLFVVSVAWGRSGNPAILEEGTFLIRGKISGAERKKLNLAVTHPIRNNDVYAVPVGEDGAFEKELPIMGTQDVYLYLSGGTVTCFSFPGDTIHLTVNAETGDYRLTGNDSLRSRELALERELSEKFRERRKEAHAYYYSFDVFPQADSVLNRAADYIADYHKTVYACADENGGLPHEAYFLQRAAFDMFYFVRDLPGLVDRLMERVIDDRNEDALWFRRPDFNPLVNSSAAFFIYTQMWSYFYDWSSISGRCDPLSAMKMAEAVVSDPRVFEWFCLRLLHFDLNLQRAGQEAEPAIDWLSSRIENPLMKKTMDGIVAEIRAALRPGQEAPDFMLKDVNGEDVSLKSLRGKFVLLDFWSTSCAPCIAEFEAADRLRREYAEYADRLSYVYVCLGQSEKRWKELVGRHEPEGVHLYAPSEKDPAVAPYAVVLFPQYILIGPDGKVVHANMPRPSSLLAHKEQYDMLGNILDGTDR